VELQNVAIISKERRTDAISKINVT